MRYMPPNIESRGLRDYLESTKSVHGNKGYDDFILFVDMSTKRKLAELFRVSDDTIRRWIKIHNKERKTK